MTTAADPWDALADANLTHDLPLEQHAWAECQCAPCTSRSLPLRGVEADGHNTSPLGAAGSALPAGDSPCCMPAPARPSREWICWVGTDRNGNTYGEARHLQLREGETVGQWVCARFAEQWRHLSVWVGVDPIEFAVIRDGRIVWADQ